MFHLDEKSIDWLMFEFASLNNVDDSLIDVISRLSNTTNSKGEQKKKKNYICWTFVVEVFFSFINIIVVNMSNDW